MTSEMLLLNKCQTEVGGGGEGSVRVWCWFSRIEHCQGVDDCLRLYAYNLLFMKLTKTSTD